jgi:hypothetical protein
MTQPVEASSRRRFIRTAVAGAVVLPIAGSLLRSEFAMSGETGHLDEADPTAKSLGYTEDTTRVDARKYPQHTPAQDCGGCRYYQGKPGSQWGPCTIFPGKGAVHAKGWCAAYVAR